MKRHSIQSITRVCEVIMTLLLLLYIKPTFGVTSEPGDTTFREVTVSNTQELLENIKPNTTIYLKPGVYEFQNDTRTEFVRTRGHQIVIHNVNELKIIGGKDTIINSSYHTIPLIYADSPTIYIKNCKNIKIENIILKNNLSSTTEIFPNVFLITSSKNISMKNMSFFGAPSLGIIISNTDGFELSNSVLKNIKQRFIDIYGSQSIHFDKVLFDKPDEGHFANIEKSYVSINDSNIKNNRFADNMVNIDEKSFLTFTNNTFSNNTGDNFTNNAESIWLKNNTFVNNSGELDDQLRGLQAKQKTKTILDYFRALSAYFNFEYPLFYKNGKWLTYNNMCDEEQEVTVDIQNGFISIYDGCFNGNVTYDFALFKNSKGEDFIGITELLYDGLIYPSSSGIGFNKFDQESLKPVDITNEIFSIGIEDFQIEGTDKQLYPKVAKLAGLKGVPLAIYKLPEIGTDLIATLIPSKGFCDYMIKFVDFYPDETEKALIKQYDDSIQTNSITFKWDKNLSRFIKKK